MKYRDDVCLYIFLSVCSHMTLFGLVSVSELVVQRKNKFLLKFITLDN